MRTVKCVQKWQWVLKLRCTKCGKKKTFYIQSKDDVPSGINGWTISDKEICPSCMFNSTHILIKEKNGVRTYKRKDGAKIFQGY